MVTVRPLERWQPDDGAIRLLDDMTDIGYSAIFLEHYRRPRNLGELDKADGVALVHEPTCGDVLRLAVRLEEGRVVEARFKAYGCAAAIAVGSVLTVLLIGREVGEVAAIRDEEVLGALDGLPASRLHVVALAREAARAVAARL